MSEIPEPQEELPAGAGGGGAGARDLQPHPAIQARLPRLKHQEAAKLLLGYDQVEGFISKCYLIELFII